MKTIKLFDDLHCGKVKDAKVNHTLFWAYIYSKDAENNTIDFNDVIWDKDVSPIVDFCRVEGIEEITISSNFSGLIPTLAEFESLGCKMAGLTKVKSRFRDCITGEQELIPAIKIFMN